MISLNVFADRFVEGGSFIMSLILISLLSAIVFLAIGFINLKKNPEKSKKMTALASDSSLLGLVIGFLGSIIGMITAFDSIQSINNVNSAVMAGGIKVSLLTVVFGTITFILPRIGIIILRALQKE